MPDLDPNEIITIPAVESDLAALLAVLSACLAELPPLKPDSAAQLFLRNIRRDSVLTAKRQNEIVGICIWSPVLRRLSLLAVLSELRRTGIASRLLHAVLDRMPPGDVTVETFQEDDPRAAAALSLYRKFGFQKDVPLEGYALPMQKYRLCRD